MKCVFCCFVYKCTDCTNYHWFNCAYCKAKKRWEKNCTDEKHCVFAAHTTHNKLEKKNIVHSCIVSHSSTACSNEWRQNDIENKRSICYSIKYVVLYELYPCRSWVNCICHLIFELIRLNFSMVNFFVVYFIEFIYINQFRSKVKNVDIRDKWLIDERWTKS